MRLSLLISGVLLAAMALGASQPAHALGSKKKTTPGITGKATPPEAALKSYIERVRAQQAAEVRTPGSIWSSEGRLVRLGTDAKAVRLHDVVGIVVTESLAATTDGQVKNSRASNASSGITSLFGKLKASNNLQNLLGMTAASALSAQGQSTTNSSLTTIFGAEVVDVLPNGMLVVQATRQLTFSQQTQLIKLRGLVRPEDVSAQNQVQSTAMTDLDLEVTGKGIVNDSTYRQNPIVRFLQKLLVF
jgi:flagellar L-ring protein precursor FlgH